MSARRHRVVITDWSGSVERFVVRGSKHAAFAQVRRLAIRRVLLRELTDAQREAAFWKLNRITIRAVPKGVRS